MQAASTMFHLLGALRRAIGRVFLVFFLFLIVAGGITEGVAFVASGEHAPVLLTHITAAVIGLSLGYAAALTVLVGEAIRALVSAIQTVEKDVKGELSGGAKILETVVHTIEGRGR